MAAGHCCGRVSTRACGRPCARTSRPCRRGRLLLRLRGTAVRGRAGTSMAASPRTDADPSAARASWYLRSAAEAAAALGVDPATGLSRAEAERRLAADGPNELRAAPPVPLWRKVLAQFQDPLVYLLLVAIAVSVAAWA